MSVTSFHFFCAFAVSLAVYYTVPKKCQWQALFLFSLIGAFRDSGSSRGPRPASRTSRFQLYTKNGLYFSTASTAGLQSMLWGVFKKLVVSERARVLVNAVYGNQDAYRGFYIWTAAFLFMLQLYTD